MANPKKQKIKADEFDLIDRMADRWGPPPSALTVGIGDDAAVWRPSPGFDTLLTSDLLVEGVHFSLKTISPWQLGARALAASLSDIAAMGGLPRVFLSALAIPRRRSLNTNFFEAFADGAKAWGDAFGATLAGGDLSSTSGPLLVDVHLMGEVERGRALQRSGVKAGDWLLCTGHPGDSAAGLALLSLPSIKKKKLDPGVLEVLARKHLLPLPRLVAGRWLLQNRAATACMDISDGVASEAGHLADQSGVGFEIDAESLPVSACARLAGKALRHRAEDWALSGGEDYELIFTVSPKKISKVMAHFSTETGTPVTVIGRATAKRGLRLRRGARLKKIEARGYRHF